MINFNFFLKFVLLYDKLMLNFSFNFDDMDCFFFLVEEGRIIDIRLGVLYCVVVFFVLIIVFLFRIDIYMYLKFYLYFNIMIVNEIIYKV